MTPMNNSKKPPWVLAKDVLVKPTRVRSRRLFICLQAWIFGWASGTERSYEFEKMVGYQFDDSKSLALNH